MTEGSPIPLDDREWRLVWDALDKDDRTRIERSVFKGHALVDPAWAAIAVAFAVRQRRAMKVWVTISVILGLGLAYVVFGSYSSRVTLGWWIAALNSLVFTVAVPIASTWRLERLRRAIEANLAVVHGASEP